MDCVSPLDKEAAIACEVRLAMSVDKITELKYHMGRALMLQHIHIKDLVIVHSLELELTSGMTALTGETGAGKSILIDALGLALGAKADKGMIRTGCDRRKSPRLSRSTGMPRFSPGWHPGNWMQKMSAWYAGCC